MKLIHTGSLTAERNMAIDRELLETLTEPTLHLYDWAHPAITHGHFTQPHDFLDVVEANRLGYHIVKRPTGGGLIFHTADYAFSVLIPSSHPKFSENTLENYNLINTAVAEVIRVFTKNTLNPSFEPCPNTQEKPSFCMAKPTCYDLVIEGKKVAGAAQRKTKKGFLHQGSISLSFSGDAARLTGPQLHQSMLYGSYFLLGSEATSFTLQEARNQLHVLMKQIFKDNNFLQ